MTKLNPMIGQSMTANEYADEWQQNASVFSASGDYTWMSAQLGDAKKIIEIGCGSGDSTEALLKDGRQVLAIESNQSCAKITSERLRAKGYSVEEISIDQLANLASWEDSGVKLLIADFLSEEIKQLLPAGHFNAIVCWLTGTYADYVAKALKKPLLQFQGSEMATYRMKIQQKCYELGVHALDHDGIVQIVDRAFVRSWDDKDFAKSEFAKQQSQVSGQKYKISQNDCAVRNLTNGLAHSNIQYIAKIPAGSNGIAILTSSRAKLA
ncbi:class I SAM-dependent methyltransferase [Janthinobacterium lividum]|uniref:class I SAM-dependent methyltransferase n=1 Tax=Janthinobacterium lividum TaxID=29581 RepID=UPI001B8101DA|nr:hypothetical protein [Janthinobacterium lividum]MBR7631845.1 hypothetical protein [Janthinobacterium lividum]